MTRKIYPLILVLLALSVPVDADIFTNRQTGETFYGYMTQRTMDSRARVYELTDDTFDSKIIDISDYDVKYDAKGRRDTVIVIPVNKKEALISKAVADTLADTIEQASDRGPLYIILEIDNPGGRGDYMNIVTKAVTDTVNCPVIAYVTGNTFGGAYSTAAAVALACEKIYISPTAAIGSVAPAHGSLTAMGGFDDYVRTYNPANISSYSAYVAKLAENNGRPAVFGAALMDKNIEVLEVKIEENGNKFIDAADKLPAQHLVKRWSQAVSSPSSSGGDYSGSSDSDDSDKTYIVTLIGEEAVHCKLADKVALTETDVLSDLGVENAKIVKSTTAGAVSEKFVKSRRTMERLMSSISQKEQIADRLDTQLNELVTRQDNSIDIQVVGSNQNTNYVPGVSGSIYYDEFGNMYSARQLRDMRRQRQADDQNVQSTRIDQNQVLRIQLTRDLVSVLRDLSGDYRQAISIGKKFPGAVPSETSVYLIENKLTALRMKLRSL